MIRTVLANEENESVVDILLADVKAALSLFGDSHQRPEIHLTTEERGHILSFQPDPFEADVTAPGRLTYEFDGKSTRLAVREGHLEGRIVLPADAVDACVELF